MSAAPHSSPPADLARQLAALDSAATDYATRFADLLLAAARAAGTSDVHLTPTAAGCELAWRIDGLLLPLGTFAAGSATSVVARLKVLAGLLTYRTDVPQEGRLAAGVDGIEIRVSTFPTLYGERAVLRLFAADRRLARLADLGLPDDVAQRLGRLLGETSGAILITGPAGSGKTTTAYACLREIIAAEGRPGGGRSIVSLEDPVEVALPGAAQSQVNEGAGLTLATGLRSLLRQDPEVIFVGEIRDRATAEITLQAALTGQLVLTTFHATSAAGAISRLADMGLEPYVLRSGVLAIVGQRLVRRLCSCARPERDEAERLGLEVTRSWHSAGCERCRGTGYSGRLVLAELLVPQGGPLGRAILARGDAEELEQLAIAAGMITRWQRACAAVEAGQTSPAEVRRVLGFGR